MYRAASLSFILVGSALAQTAVLRPAERIVLPTHIDGNSPSFWDEEGLRLFSSTGNPEMISAGPDMFGPWYSDPVDVSRVEHQPLWIESAWRDADGTVFGWYHHEPGGLCDGKLTAPKIGAVVSFDGGRSVEDLGIVLESGAAPDCGSRNGFFAGGHGDFSVVLDREGKYFYFFFTNYGGDPGEQGVVTARMAFEDRFAPAGAVWKYRDGEWNEPGLGGSMTPIFRAETNWQRSDTNSFWGPSVHWNTHLEKFVILMNHSCCEEGWPQEGIYISYGADPSQPSEWRQPLRILEGSKIGYQPGYYPQVMGLGEGETDSLAGERARLFIHGSSTWEIHFLHEEEIPPVEPADPFVPGTEETTRRK